MVGGGGCGDDDNDDDGAAANDMMIDVPDDASDDVDDDASSFLDVNMGAPGLVRGPCIVEIDRVVIGVDQYHFEENRCRNEEFQGSSANSVGGDSGQDGSMDRRRR
ncbi:hypothetical protein DPMN_132705 [Dreissena polymorpha]|uniref:Uncharacterized protein n=1 Tax=Dreissena polymorpha TaxID=45954 RepID=A0A9D4FX74_DREPO|nr:hypothetical protein DPMN_132705 [Dreissena polymorpha]